ncbi:hypothetical protein F4859DRAFT_509779 [Xylaria cf. heliscus]|nr:hypothetical protein F4859DRAFT_509779 [Xylaria cf. heliscus]
MGKVYGLQPSVLSPQSSVPQPEDRQPSRLSRPCRQGQVADSKQVDPSTPRKQASTAVDARFTLYTSHSTIPSHAVARSHGSPATNHLAEVEAQEKAKVPKGRAKKRLQYTRRFVNVTLTGGKRKMNPNPGS